MSVTGHIDSCRSRDFKRRILHARRMGFFEFVITRSNGKRHFGQRKNPSDIKCDGICAGCQERKNIFSESPQGVEYCESCTEGLYRMKEIA